MNLTTEELQRLISKTVPNGECLEFVGHKTPKGYGMMEFRKRSEYAHRLMFLAVHGRFPLVTDHLCRNRSCVNPLHLEEVTYLENGRRAVGNVCTINANKTHCIHGHLLPPYPPRRGTCRECIRIYQAGYRARKRCKL